jgi:hypothetical protein
VISVRRVQQPPTCVKVSKEQEHEAKPVPHTNPAAPLRIEFTPEYQAEFDRLLAIAGKAEKAFKKARDEYDRACVALEWHIESRHYR